MERGAVRGGGGRKERQPIDHHLDLPAATNEGDVPRMKSCCDGNGTVLAPLTCWRR